MVLPSVLYGTNIINLTEDNIKELQKIENSVYKSIMGAAHYSPNVTLRGEIGASLVKKRVINGRINYIKGIQIQYECGHNNEMPFFGVLLLKNYYNQT